MVAVAAYRSGTKLRDDRYGTTHYYAGRTRVTCAEIMGPAQTPSWARDREALWNRVEACEPRKDSQLARLIELGLPLELSTVQNLELLRDYVATTFVSKGMIADFSLWCEGAHHPHAHILLTLREATQEGFGPKARHWNGKANLLQWRAAWADLVNEHLARAGHSTRIDHRSLEAQQIELTPSRRVGLGSPSRSFDRLPEHISERMVEQRHIAGQNGQAMLDDPTLALRALTQQQPRFTLPELARFLGSRTDGEAQFAEVYRSVTGSSDLVALPTLPGAEARYSSRDLVDAARSLQQRTASMAARQGHGITAATRHAVLSQFSFDEKWLGIFDHLTGPWDLRAQALPDVGARDELKAALRHAWAAEGVTPMDVLRTQGVLSRLEEWRAGTDLPSRHHVVLVDGAELIGIKALERLLGFADKARSKVVLLASQARLDAIKGDSPLADVLSLLATFVP